MHGRERLEIMRGSAGESISTTFLYLKDLRRFNSMHDSNSYHTSTGRLHVAQIGPIMSSDVAGIHAQGALRWATR